jgi:hypothetical protein
MTDATLYAHEERALRVREAQTPNTRNQDTNKIAQYCIDPYWILGKTCNQKGSFSIQAMVKDHRFLNTYLVKGKKIWLKGNEIYHERSPSTYKSQGYYYSQYA